MLPKIYLSWACALLLAGMAGTQAAEVVVNEWNAVGGAGPIPDGDSFFGEITGNGGNWIELLVIQDVDMRGWKLNWVEQEATAAGDPFTEGTITFSTDTLWSTVKAGSIITIIETSDADGENVDTSTDVSFDPANDDWWINVATTEEIGRANPLITTVTNDGADGEFSVGNDDWTVTILDGNDEVIFGPVGEGATDSDGNVIWPGGGVSSSEAGSLEGPGRGAPLACWQSITAADPFYDDTKSSSFGQPNVDFQIDTLEYRTTQDLTALRGGTPEGFGDFDSSDTFDLADIDSLTDEIANDNHSPCFDLTGDGTVDSADLEDLVVNRVGTLMGDADLDGDVDVMDYETWNTNLFVAGNTWATGDFNADGSTDVSDFNIWNDNKTSGQAASASAVPEPNALLLITISLSAFAPFFRNLLGNTSPQRKHGALGYAHHGVSANTGVPCLRCGPVSLAQLQN